MMATYGIPSHLRHLSYLRPTNQFKHTASASYLKFFSATSTKDQEPKPEKAAASEQTQSKEAPPESDAEAKRETRDGDQELKQLYDATLTKVGEHGWTESAIEAAVAELGWSPAAKRMISRGPVEVVEEFILRCNRDLAETLASENDKAAAAAGGTDPVGRATFAMRTRLEKLEPYHHNWARALALQALPQNSPKAIRSAALLVDEFAHYAGYRSSDMSWYTDRAVLGMAYQAAELYWLTDTSPQRTDTWRFIESRLRDCHTLRTGITSTYESIMTLSDAATGSMRTVLRSAWRNY